jgi:hypothetical protein
VRYVLEGSVRKAGERVRITGQLIDAMSSTHLWADRFEGVPPGTPIVTLVPGDSSLLKAGNHVILSASHGTDGSLMASRITVGKDGLVPPM